MREVALLPPFKPFPGLLHVSFKLASPIVLSRSFHLFAPALLQQSILFFDLTGWLHTMEGDTAGSGSWEAGEGDIRNSTSKDD